MRLRKQNVPFTMVANEVLYRTDISLKAKGIFAYLFSKPEDWDFAADRIARECKEERKAVLGALKELETAGLLKRAKLPDGRMVYDLEYTESQSPKSGLGLFDAEPKSRNGTVPKVHGAESGPISKTKLSTKTEEESKRDALQVFEEEARKKVPAYAAIIHALAGKDYLSATQIHREILEKFIPYWTEMSPGGKKQRWQKQTVFDIKRRVVTWIGNIHERKGDYKCKEFSKWHRAGERCDCTVPEHMRSSSAAPVDKTKPLLPPEFAGRTAALAAAKKL